MVRDELSMYDLSLARDVVVGVEEDFDEEV
jgi:hypothetical protein